MGEADCIGVSPASMMRMMSESNLELPVMKAQAWSILKNNAPTEERVRVGEMIENQ